MKTTLMLAALLAVIPASIAQTASSPSRTPWVQSTVPAVNHTTRAKCEAQAKLDAVVLKKDMTCTQVSTIRYIPAPTPSPTSTPSPTPTPPAPSPTPTPTASPSPSPTPTPPSASVQVVPPCVAGAGRDFQVGPGAGQLASLDQVPWESLKAGDTVRIFYKPTAYKGKVFISAEGTATMPVRVCGVKGPNGERPVVDGNGANTRAQLAGFYGAQGSQGVVYNETRGVFFIGRPASAAWQFYPKHVQIDGLKITGAHPNYGFTDGWGVQKKYLTFGACVWADRGHNITIADNEITDCSQAIYTKSTDDGEFAVTTNIRIAGNTFTDIGHSSNAQSNINHTTYTASKNIVFEFNRYGPIKAGSPGNSIKDRSIGTVIRYNRIEDGARFVDLVEAQDFPATATKDPAYRTTFVYGNQMVKDGGKGSGIHYGGDSNGSTPGATWGEPVNRKGTLYFFHNTVRLTGNGYGVMFQLSTTEERAEVHNNIFIWDASIPEKSFRSKTDVGAAWTSGGIVNLGTNWASQGWQDSDQWHPVPGQLNGTGNLLTGSAAPVDTSMFAPLAGSSVIDKASALPPALAGHPVQYQLIGGKWAKRDVTGAAFELGAVELNK